MTPDARLEAIFARLGDIEKNSAAHHERVEGQMARIGDRLDALNDKVKTQNGRVSKLETQVGDLQMRARIAEHHDAEAEEQQDKFSARAWGFITGSSLVILGAVLGHFL